ncbi:MAG: cytochrome c maturation protein CcmE [Planctomycetes bacterium]|nr:cytochrome c maturation protein CcmE [Planctomycetota bacterium]
MRIVVPGLLILAGLVGLVTLGILEGGIPELQVHEALEGVHPGRPVKVHGLIGEIASDRRPLRFTVLDKKDPESRMDVVADRTRPDTFQETYDVAVLGTWDPQARVFRADQVYTKCPSKYEAEDKRQTGASAGDRGSP